MSRDNNTLLLRLAGPMQSWGTASRFQLRRTDLHPSKSGVLGMLLCANGVRREQSRPVLEHLAKLEMGVRIDRQGTVDWDYHTVGAKVGIRSADGEIKRTQSKSAWKMPRQRFLPWVRTARRLDEYETLLSRRQYLYDASFLVALRGNADTIDEYSRALGDPAWPLYLGRKCCVPGEPVLHSIGKWATLSDALASVPWQPGINDGDDNAGHTTRTLTIYLESPPGVPVPEVAWLVYDVPVVFGFYSYGPRWLVQSQVTVPVQPLTRLGRPHRASAYSEHFRKVAAPHRMQSDNYVCVFCHSPASAVHHVSYENAGHETDADLRSLCKTCHDACTMLEYGHGRTQRVDPLDPAQHAAIVEQIKRIVGERRPRRQGQLLGVARSA